MLRQFNAIFAKEAQIDSAILATDKVICKNISRFDDSERGLLSQNILSQLRNFVEYIADKVYANGSDLDPNNYALNVEALKYLQTRGDLRFLHQFHELLQKSVSHYTLDEKGYADDSAFIIQKLRDLATSGIAQYTGSVDSWLNKGSYSIDSPEKKDALRNMFAKSQVALIYGSAGTGKSTLINHISNFFSNQKKLYLANTHPAVDNMRRKVTASNREFNTIASFISEKNQQ